jgi:hypothetical protein
MSVDSEEEADALLRRCCEIVWVDSLNTTGFIAAELEAEQTLGNLQRFGDRLRTEYHKMLKKKVQACSLGSMSRHTNHPI